MTGSSVWRDLFLGIVSKIPFEQPSIIWTGMLRKDGLSSRLDFHAQAGHPKAMPTSSTESRQGAHPVAK
jgi:hypothetical protein